MTKPERLRSGFCLLAMYRRLGAPTLTLEGIQSLTVRTGYFALQSTS